MGEDTVGEVRLVCICGQRMRISPSMLGKPGRCVSCKQKIRVPRADEIPEGVATISLEDHPEFLRKSPLAGKKTSEKAESPEVVLGESGEERPVAAPAVSMDILEPLRALVSLEYRITHKLTVLRSGDVDPQESKYDPRQLERYLERIKEVRSQLEQELREKTLETETELKSVEERLGQLGLNARAGEIEFATYREQVEKLRRRRDILMRRLHNLKAWLVVRSPYEAGGYVRLPMDYEPDIANRIVFRHEPEENVPLVDWWIRALRDALTQKEFAERKIAEAWRMESQGLGDTLELGHRRADAEGEKDRALATIAFCRDRLAQLERDYRGDLQILNDQMSIFKGRLSVGALTKGEFSALSKEKARTSSELMSALEMIRRALHSDSSRSLPPLSEAPAGTSRRASSVAASADAWCMWIGASLLVVALFIPTLSTLSAFEMVGQLRAVTPNIYWVVLIPLVGGLAVFGIAFVSSALVRGTITFLVWYVLVLGLAVFRQECLNSTGLLGDYFGGGTWWFLTPGMLMFLCALLVILAGGFIALSRVTFGWLLGMAILLFTGVWVAIIATDFAGILRARPVLASPIRIQPGDEPGLYDAEITLMNQGKRPLVLNPRSPFLRNGIDFGVERRSSNGEWEDAGNPARLYMNDAELPLQGGRMNHVILPAGNAARFIYRLTPGEYRVVLGAAQTAATFSVEEPPEIATLQPESAGSEPPPSAEPEPAPVVPAAPDQPLVPSSPQTGMQEMPVEVELNGFLSAEGRGPQFRIVIHYPNGQVRTRLLPLLGELDGGWFVSEFNREEETITLSRAGKYLILRRGKREILPTD